MELIYFHSNSSSPIIIDNNEYIFNYSTIKQNETVTYILTGYINLKHNTEVEIYSIKKYIANNYPFFFEYKIHENVLHIMNKLVYNFIVENCIDDIIKIENSLTNEFIITFIQDYIQNELSLRISHNSIKFNNELDIIESFYICYKLEKNENFISNYFSDKNLKDKVHDFYVFCNKLKNNNFTFNNNMFIKNK